MMPKRHLQPLRLEKITDVYISISTKHGTRESRGENTTRIHISAFGQKMPDTETSWQSLLSNSENKIDLLLLFAEYLKSEDVREKNYCSRCCNTRS